MEIETAPRPPGADAVGAAASLLVVLFGPVTLLVLLPIGLGLQRYVMTGDSMDGGLGHRPRHRSPSSAPSRSATCGSAT